MQGVTQNSGMLKLSAKNAGQTGGQPAPVDCGGGADRGRVGGHLFGCIPQSCAWQDRDRIPAGGGQAGGGWGHGIGLSQWGARGYALQGVPGVAEVASVGGFVKTYQVTVDPQKLQAYGIPLPRVAQAIRMSNTDVGGRVAGSNASAPKRQADR